jgi:hypothetical protein
MKFIVLTAFLAGCGPALALESPPPQNCIEASALRADLPRYQGEIAARAVAVYNAMPGDRIDGAAEIIMRRTREDLTIAFVQNDRACWRLHAVEPAAAALYDLIMSGPGDPS